MPTPEELARQNIDALLEQCGWIIQNYKQLDLSAGRGIAIREVRLKEGRCDYLLLIDRKPVGIIVLCGCFRLFPKRRRHRCLAVTDAQQRPGFPSKCVRSGTSVGANYREAHRARSKAEFIAKCGDSLREIEESAYWLERFLGSGLVSTEKLQPLCQECDELTAIFVTILKRSKQP